MGERTFIVNAATHKMCTIRKREEGQYLSNLLIFEYGTSRELNLGANLRPKV